MSVVFSPLPLSPVMGSHPSESFCLLPNMTIFDNMTALPAFLLTSACFFPGDDRHIPTVMLD